MVRFSFAQDSIRQQRHRSLRSKGVSSCASITQQLAKTAGDHGHVFVHTYNTLVRITAS